MNVTRRSIADTWRQIERELPNEMELLGVTYHGPDAAEAWIAVAQRGGADNGNAEFCEGTGATPGEALVALLDHARTEH